MRDHDMLYVGIQDSLSGSRRLQEALYGRGRLQLDLQLLFQLPDGGEVLLETAPIVHPNLAQQLKSVLLDSREHAAPDHRVGIRFEIRGIGILEACTEDALVQRERRYLTRIGRT